MTSVRLCRGTPVVPSWLLAWWDRWSRHSQVSYVFVVGRWAVSVEGFLRQTGEDLWALVPHGSGGGSPCTTHSRRSPMGWVVTLPGRDTPWTPSAITFIGWRI